MSLLKEKLLELRDSIQEDGVVTRGEILSLESAFDKAVFSDNMDVSFLSSSPSKVGVDDVLRIIDSTISNEDAIKLEMTTRENTPISIACILEEMDAKLTNYQEREEAIWKVTKTFGDSRFLENLLANVLTYEYKGRFYKIADIPLEALADLDESFLILACGNDVDEYDRIKKIFKSRNLERHIEDKFESPLFTTHHALKHIVSKAEKEFEGDNKDLGQLIHRFYHTELSNNCNLTYLLWTILAYSIICPCAVRQHCLSVAYEMGSVSTISDVKEYNKVIQHVIESLSVYKQVGDAIASLTYA